MDEPQRGAQLQASATRTMATILVVDDEPGFRQFGQTVLEREGYRVLTAANGRVALELFQEHKPEIVLVVTDVVMPDMDGVELIQELTRLSPQTRIIAMSGGGRDGTDVFTRAKEAGAAVVLQKPFRKAGLLAALRS